MIILHITRINLTSGRTNTYNVAKTCETINAQEDYSVKLLTTDQKKSIPDFFYRMGVRRPFDVVCLGVTNATSKYIGRRWHTFFMFIYVNLYVFWYFIIHFKDFDIVYYRDDSLFPAAFCAGKILRKKVFFETHLVLERKFRQLINTACVKFADGVIAISSGLRHYYQKSNSNILLSLCSAAEDLWFDSSHDKYSFRRQLGLPKEIFLIGYAGLIGVNPNNDYYETDDIVRSLVLLPKDIVFIMVGELNSDADWLRDIALDIGALDRVIIFPWMQRSNIPKYLQACDIILIPKRKKNRIGDTPAKIFPALASGRPIVAGRAGGIQEVLTDGVDAVILEKNNPDEWAKAILRIYNDRKFGEKISNQALITKNKYTWEKRGIDIVGFITKTLKAK